MGRRREYNLHHIQFTRVKFASLNLNTDDDFPRPVYTQVEEKGGSFLGGSKPCIADIAVFGVLRSLTNFDTFDDIMTNTKVKPWYERVQQEVGEASRISEKIEHQAGEMLAS